MKYIDSIGVNGREYRHCGEDGEGKSHLVFFLKNDFLEWSQARMARKEDKIYTSVKIRYTC